MYVEREESYMDENASFIERQSADPDLDPYPNFRWLRENDPVSLVAEGEGSQTFLVTSFDQVRSCLLDPRLNADGAVPDEEVIGADPREHDRLRAIMSKMLPNSLVEQLRPKIAQICEELLDRFAGRGHAELAAEYALPLPVAVMHEIFGVP